MAFCPQCGSPLNPEHRFCPNCAAPAQPGVSHPPRQGGIHAQPSSGSGKRIAWMVGGVLAIAAVIVVLWMTGVIFGMSPRESGEQLHLAYERHDLAAFDRYFDSESVVGDFLDQMAAMNIQNQEMRQVRAHLPEFADALKRSLLGLPPPVQSAEIQRLTFQLCREQTQIMAELGVYKGIASDTRSGPDAIVSAMWSDPRRRSTETVTIDFKLRPSGNHWRVVAIPNLALLLRLR